MAVALLHILAQLAVHWIDHHNDVSCGPVELAVEFSLSSQVSWC